MCELSRLCQATDLGCMSPSTHHDLELENAPSVIWRETQVLGLLLQVFKYAVFHLTLYGVFAADGSLIGSFYLGDIQVNSIFQMALAL